MNYPVYHIDKRYGVGYIKDIKGNNLEIEFPDAKLGDPKQIREMNANYIGSKLLPFENANKEDCQQFRIKLKKAFETEKKIRDELVPKLKKSKMELKQFIPGYFDQKGIQYLVHFTPIENLPSILKYGLVPLSQQKQKGILAKKNDGKRLEGMPDCTNLSISFPNYKMVQYKGLVNYVVLKISPSILYCDQRDVFFFATNAAKYNRRLPDDKYIFQDTESLKQMFLETLVLDEKNVSESHRSTRSILKLDACYTSDPQAEILVSEVIPSEFIMEICVKSEQRAQDLSQNLIKISHPPIIVNKSMFSYRHDYKFWQKGQEYGTENVL